MARRSRPTYKKIVSDRNLPKCFYCKSRTDSVLLFPSGEEVWCCKPCAILHGKIKRFRLRIDKPLLSRKKLKISEIYTGKNKKVAISEQGRGAEDD